MEESAHPGEEKKGMLVVADEALCQAVQHEYCIGDQIPLIFRGECDRKGNIRKNAELKSPQPGSIIKKSGVSSKVRWSALPANRFFCHGRSHPIFN
jgi:hypothetical protein